MESPSCDEDDKEDRLLLLLLLLVPRLLVVEVEEFPDVVGDNVSAISPSLHDRRDIWDASDVLFLLILCSLSFCCCCCCSKLLLLVTVPSSESAAELPPVLTRCISALLIRCR